MPQEFEDEDVYVLLDFQGKDTSMFLKQPNIYFKMLNLNESKPIVEIGEDVYEGTYDDAMGTNVYFEEIEDPPAIQDTFVASTPISLQYLLKQTKVLKMEKIGRKPKPVMNMKPTEMVDINIKDDYRVLLEKYENSKLNIEEYIVDDQVEDEDSPEGTPLEKSDNDHDDKEEEVEDERPEQEWKPSQLPARQSTVPEWFSVNSDPVKSTSKPEQVDPTYAKYMKLQRLAEQPTKHKKTAEDIGDERTDETPFNNLPKSEFLTWKDSIMRKVEQQKINLDINKDKIEDFVDIEGSIKSGIIAPSNDIPRVFTKSEKAELLSFKNFIHVSPLMKLIMLEDYVKLEKSVIKQMTPEQLNETGEDNCTVQEKFELLKKFKDELQGYIVLCLQDESDDIEEFEKDINLEKLLNDDYASELNYSFSTDEDEDNEDLEDEDSSRETSQMEVEEEEDEENHEEQKK